MNISKTEMMRTPYSAAAILLLIMSLCIMCDKKELNNIFYVQNTLDGFDNSPMAPGEKAKLLKSIGYDGLEMIKQSRDYLFHRRKFHGWSQADAYQQAV